MLTVTKPDGSVISMQQALMELSFQKGRCSAALDILKRQREEDKRQELIELLRKLV